ncbi:MAG: antitoxin Xre/MbcA/ParS toxin-binding domain-containing protein, partial [bacterium]|nr:antitoxin Xre/MbcA/ParS toxin-binding domain-containing protein [bacterium]
FPWLKRGNRQHKNWKNTVLGHLEIKKNQLKISVNSEKRANTIKKKIETVLKGEAVYQRTKIQSAESLMKMAEKKSKQKSDFAAENEPLSPELQEILDNQIEEEWKLWLHKKIPALGNITPTKAIKDPDGREMVKALLDDFELKDKQANPQQKQQKYIDWARKQLGLS